MNFLCICLLALGVYGAASELEDEMTAGVELVWAMLQDSDWVNLDEGYAVAKDVKTEVCYPEVGCFSKVDGPFSFSSLHPEEPESIKTRFSLFTPHNKDSPVALSYLDKDTLDTGLFDPSLTFAVISHGLNENDGKIWIKNVKNALLGKGYGGVLVLDWSNGAMLPFYGQAMVNSELVGRQLALVLQLLHERRGLVLDNVHLIGYSLGAHLSGFAAKTVSKKLNAKVGRITGLDPAGPNFEDKDGRVHLSSDDATFVDVIHSSSGTSILMGDLGIVKAIGHVDFYPNGGKNQPGCGFLDITCSHRRANELFIESMSSNECNFLAYHCSGGYEDFKAGKCRDCASEGCAVLGLQSSTTNPRGSVYFTTKKSAPYCLNEP